MNANVWKTIKLGFAPKTTHDMLRALEIQKIRFDGFVYRVLKENVFTSIARPTRVDLVKTTVDELGFDKSATREYIFIRAQKDGLKLGPPETAIRLRLQYIDQPYGEWIIIATKPIYCQGVSRILGLTRDASGLALVSLPANSNCHWISQRKLVFVSNMFDIPPAQAPEGFLFDIELKSSSVKTRTLKIESEDKMSADSIFYYVGISSVVFIILFILFNLIRKGPCPFCNNKGYVWKDGDDGERVKDTCICRFAKDKKAR